MKKIIIALGFLGILVGSTNLVFAGYFNTTPIATCNVQITRNLQIGSENNDVYVLQNMLSQAGYLNANPNGYFGYGTRSALKSFQLDNGISTTGTVGEQTRNAVNERLCDNDKRGDNLSYNSYDNYGYGNGYNYGYGYNSSVTYVDQYDPYAVVVSPPVTTPVIYATPQNNNVNTYSQNINNTSYYSPSNNYQVLPPVVPATTQIQSTNIVYNPSTGYTYSIVPVPGVLTISTPVANTVYNEGDTVYVAFSTSNINATNYQILLENTTTGQSKIATITGNNNTSFVLTKELLDAVCAGACDNNQQGTFRIVITTPITDIAGVTSVFRAAVSPVTIKRPYSITSLVSITTSKTPVNSGEAFKLYINVPNVPVWNNIYGNYSIKIHAICPTSVYTSIAGVSCGQDFSMPVSQTSFQQEIPVIITNSTWYKHDVIFEIIMSSISGQVIGTGRTSVTANSAPFNW